jgi:Amt family ammonium transporter
MLTSMALVLFMTIPGLSLFYGGLVRSKNVLSVLMQGFTITCVITIVWLGWGYSLAFTDGGALNQWVGGLSQFFHKDMARDAVSGTIPESVFSMFQLTFAIITPVLIIGAFAERMKLSAMIWFMVLWSTFVYSPICHWVWGGGWLSDLGVLDFAGGTVVHINSGVAALVCALVMGKRKGFPEAPMAPHNLTMAMIGVCMLWVGWFGFNAGSQLAADTGAGMAMMVTQIGTASAALGWMVAEWIKRGRPSLLGVITGAVVGLVAITPASGFVGQVGAMVLCGIAGVICFFCVNFVKNTLEIDDSLDVFAVHGVGGTVGAILTGVFVFLWNGAQAGEPGMGKQIGLQFIGVIATYVWCGVLTFIILKLVDLFIGLRVTSDEETEGLDIVLHGERGYDI